MYRIAHDIQVRAIAVDQMVNKALYENEIYLFTIKKDEPQDAEDWKSFFIQEIQNRHEKTARIYQEYYFKPLRWLFLDEPEGGIFSPSHLELQLRLAGYQQVFDCSYSSFKSQDEDSLYEVMPSVFTKCQFITIAECASELIQNFSSEVHSCRRTLVRNTNFLRRRREYINDIAVLAKLGVSVSRSKNFELLCNKGMEEIFPSLHSLEKITMPYAIREAGFLFGAEQLIRETYRIFTYLDILHYAGYEMKVERIDRTKM